jgi:IclR family acetate operon transcriptional repressor
MRVLGLFVGDRVSLSLTDIARDARIPKSTAHRLATALCEISFLWRDPQDDRFRLGSFAVKIGHKALAHRDLRAIARPVMRELARRTNETVVLAVVNATRDHAVCIEQIASPFGFRLVAGIGVQLPLHAGGLSRVLLAHMETQEIERALAQPLARLAPGTITDPTQVRESLAEIRRRGYTVSVEETCDGAAGISVPIFDCDRQILASLGASGPRSRIPPAQKWLPHVRAAAERIAAGIGGFIPSVSGASDHKRPAKGRSKRTGA